MATGTGSSGSDRRGRNPGRGPGILRLRRTAAPGTCPFCGDPLKKGAFKRWVTCGDEVCQTAYLRYYARSRRKIERMGSAARAVTEIASSLEIKLAGLLA